MTDDTALTPATPSKTPAITPALDQKGRNAAESDGRMPHGGFNALVPELDVRDIERSLDFWCGLLGFDVAYDRKAARFAYLEREGAQLKLCEINGEWMTGALEPPFGRGINLQIAVSDLGSIALRLEQASWPLFRDIREATYRVAGSALASRELLVQDPDGYLVRLAESLPVGR